MKKKRTVIAFALVLCMALLGGCSASEKIMQALNKEQVFTVNNLGCEKAEYIVYLSTTQARYEEVYGAEVWNISKGDENLEDNVKQTVLARIARVKIMYLMAKAQGISLDEKEQEKVKQAAEQYMELLPEETATQMELTAELLESMYEQYALSEKLYDKIVSQVNPEISDDEARTITVQSILIKTWTTDGTGERVYYSDAMKAEARETAEKVVALAKEGEDFQELISKYNEDTESVLYIGKGEVDPELERMAFALETEEISPVIETVDGYRIIKCISTFEREQTEKNKKAMVEKRKEEAFTEQYQAFVDTVESKLNTKLMEEIAPDHTDKLEVPDFFEIYSNLF